MELHAPTHRLLFDTEFSCFSSPANFGDVGDGAVFFVGLGLVVRMLLTVRFLLTVGWRGKGCRIL